MARRIVIRFEPHPEWDIRTVRRSAMDLWRACRDDTDGWAKTSFDEACDVTDRLVVGVASAKRVRRVVRMVEDLVQEHYLDRCARVVVQDAG